MTDEATSPTTVALHSPSGRGGIAVLELRGPRADEIIRRAMGLPAERELRDGQLHLGRLSDENGLIDEAIICRRGQAVEINVHGGPAVEAACLRLLKRLGAQAVAAPPASADSFPLAHPRRANPAIGRELVELLPRAASPLVVAALARQWSAGISSLARRCIEKPSRELAGALRAAAGRLEVMLRAIEPAEVVIAGPPNVGKSTLTNALVGRDVSIVHDMPGTTRDWVREPALLRGLGVWVTDTAGLWDPADGPDAEAVRRARARIALADVVCLLAVGRRPDIPTWMAGRAPRPAGRRRRRG
ncbi:MAG: 50S ribosome-binding GTPase, partial [Planctomycetes bacterium]|nr:50S ribosome-binding GTPase [Planctomycetota bacterium]